MAINFDQYGTLTQKVVIAVTLTAALVGVIGFLKPYYHIKAETSRSVASNVSAAEAVQWVDCLVAGADLPAGADLQNAPIEFKRYPVQQLPTRALTNRAELAKKWTATLIKKGTPITAEDLADQLLNVSIDPKVGYRGAAVTVTKADAANGNVRPRSRVNLILTTGKGERAVSRYLAENIEVLSVGFKNGKKVQGRLADFSLSGPGTELTVTLEVLPETVLLIEQARGAGELSLALLNPTDNAPAPVQQVGIKEVIAGSKDNSAPTKDCKRSRIEKDGKIIEWGCDDKVNAVINRETQ